MRTHAQACVCWSKYTTDGASEAGDLSKPTATAYFFGIKLMFVGVMNFGEVQKIRFVGVKNFRSCSIPNFGLFIGHVNKPHFNPIKKFLYIFSDFLQKVNE